MNVIFTNDDMVQIGSGKKITKKAYFDFLEEAIYLGKITDFNCDENGIFTYKSVQEEFTVDVGNNTENFKVLVNLLRLQKAMHKDIKKEEKKEETMKETPTLAEAEKEKEDEIKSSKNDLSKVRKNIVEGISAALPFVDIGLFSDVFGKISHGLGLLFSVLEVAFFLTSLIILRDAPTLIFMRYLCLGLFVDSVVATATTIFSREHLPVTIGSTVFSAIISAIPLVFDLVRELVGMILVLMIGLISLPSDIAKGISLRKKIKELKKELKKIKNEIKEVNKLKKQTIANDEANNNNLNQAIDAELNRIYGKIRLLPHGDRTEITKELLETLKTFHNKLLDCNERELAVEDEEAVLNGLYMELFKLDMKIEEKLKKKTRMVATSDGNVFEEEQENKRGSRI